MLCTARMLCTYFRVRYISGICSPRSFFTIWKTADFYAASEIRVAIVILDRDVLEDLCQHESSRTRLYQNVSLLGTWSCVDLNLEQNRDCRSYPADSINRFFIFFCRLCYEVIASFRVSWRSKGIFLILDECLDDRKIVLWFFSEIFSVFEFINIWNFRFARYLQLFQCPLISHRSNT